MRILGIRYVLREAPLPGFWMVWDRRRRGPAVLHDRRLGRLSLQQAEAALASLTGIGASLDRGSTIEGARWLVIYGGGLTVDCRDERDAKRLARDLVLKGRRVSARTAEGEWAPRAIEKEQSSAWLSE
jgi:hypothetical protein